MLFKHLDTTHSQVTPVTLAGVPPQLDAVFDLLKTAGAEWFALFGGAVRDADYAAYHHKSVTIKDYDLRIWFTLDDFDNQTALFIKKLNALTGEEVKLVPSAGTGRIRYVILYKETELDISIRPIPMQFNGKTISSETIAMERAFDSDVGISAVAIASNKQAYARHEYLSDRMNKTLTICQHGNLERVRVYLERMQTKFPDHRSYPGLKGV